jgi:hypothetical protein
MKERTEKKLVNLTTHTLTDVSTSQVFPPSGSVARVDFYRDVNKINLEGYESEIQVSDTIYQEIVGLPEFDINKVFVVSAFVLNALSYKGIYRSDVIAPGPKITGPNKKTVGCNSFRKNG